MDVLLCKVLDCNWSWLSVEVIEAGPANARAYGRKLSVVVPVEREPGAMGVPRNDERTRLTELLEGQFRDKVIRVAIDPTKVFADHGIVREVRGEIEVVN